MDGGRAGGVPPGHEPPEGGRGGREIVEKNGDDPFEAFFAHEALALAHHALGDAAAARREGDAAAALLPKIEEDSRAYCEGESKKLGATLAGAAR